MNLISQLPTDLNLQILALLEIPEIIRCQQLSRSIYWSFRREVFPNHYYFDFSSTPIKYLHWTIMYNKEDIIKWLINHYIWNAGKFITLRQLDRTFNTLRINCADITLALAVIFSPKRIIQFLHENKVRPIGFMDNPLFSFEGLEIALAKKYRDNEIVYLLEKTIYKRRNLGNSNSYHNSNNFYEFRLVRFIMAMQNYRHLKYGKRWNHEEMLQV